MKRHNLLFIFTDQQRADSLGCYGSTTGATPNLDRLAEESLVFENAYVTQPTCTPSRASILTGLYPHNHGATRNNLRLAPEIPTLAEMVSDDTYRAYYGKWHLGDEVVAQHGFDEWLSFEDGYREHYSRPEYLERFSDYHHYLLAAGYEPDLVVDGARVFSRQMVAALPEEHTKARFLGRETARFLHDFRQKRGRRPFILYVAFLEPHPPYISPLAERFPAGALPVGQTFRKVPEEDTARVNRLRALNYMEAGRRHGQDLTTEAGMRTLRSHYTGNVALVDRAVGDILQALRESGLEDETLVVYSSDHGDMLGDHGMFAKFVMYEEAIRVPLLVRIPWLREARGDVTGRFSQVDLVPTLLELLGHPVPESLDGESRARVVWGEESLTDNDVFVEWNGPDGRPGKLFPGGVPQHEWAAVRGAWRTIIGREGWKLNLSRHDRCELYDLNNDPHEEKNLFNDPAQSERVLALIERLRRWQERTGDTALLPGWIGRTGEAYPEP